MSTATINEQLESLEIPKAGEFNPMSVLSERQRIALSSKWNALKEAERDEYNEFIAKGVSDSATLYVIASIQTEANNRIFSESRPAYLSLMQQWYQSLTSKDDTIRKYAETELKKVSETCTGNQIGTLLSALKAVLLRGKTFLPEATEKPFRALCRLYGFDVNMLK